MSGLTIQYQIYDVAGSYTFTPPDPAIQVVWADILGGGTGGCGTNNYGVSGEAGGGGGGGEFLERVMIPIAGGSLTVVVGDGTAGSIATTGAVAAPADAGFSSVGNRVAMGGRSRSIFGQNTYRGGWGGGPGGGQTLAGIPSQSTKGNRETPRETGGWSGGGGGIRSANTETEPKDCPGTATTALSGTPGAGGGGAGSPYGPGGTGGNDGVHHPGSSSAWPGTGGGGAGSAGAPGSGATGGTGSDGKVILYWSSPM